MSPNLSPIKPAELARFDYGQIEDADPRSSVRRRADDIRTLVMRSAANFMKIGRHLTAVKEQLPHGQFQAWIRDAFDWERSSARRFMQVARRFGGLDCVNQFGMKALVELSSGKLDVQP